MPSTKRRHSPPRTNLGPLGKAHQRNRKHKGQRRTQGVCSEISHVRSSLDLIMIRKCSARKRRLAKDFDATIRAFLYAASEDWHAHHDFRK